MASIHDEYPKSKVMLFGKLDERQMAVILDAARKLHLPFEIEGQNLSVVVDSPMDAYNFGSETQRILLRKRKKHR